MNIPFTTEQFLSVFGAYNQSIWPFQIFLNGLGVGALIFAMKRFSTSDRIIAGILAFLWLWIGVAYHLVFFTSINPGAYAFGVLNIFQSVLFLIFGVVRPQLTFTYRNNVYGLTGALFVLYALVIYPMLGFYFGHVFPKAPTFGLPCPTTIFTFGLLLWTDAPIPRSVLLIPFLWSLIGFTAAVTMGIHEDIGLLVAGLLGSALIILRDRNAVRKKAGVGRFT
jgi:hypothetical protein